MSVHDNQQEEAMKKFRKVFDRRKSNMDNVNYAAVFYGRELKSLGLSFTKNTIESECHNGVQFPLEGGWVEDIRELDTQNLIGAGLHFCPSTTAHCWENWPDHTDLTSRASMIAKWKRVVTFDNDEKIFCVDHSWFGFVFRAHRIHVGPRQSI